MLLVRHCQSTGQAADAPLTQEGLAQAQRLANFLIGWPVDRVVCSPFQRARQSIAPYAVRAGLLVELDPRLQERTLASASIPHWRAVVERAFTDLDHREPGGESGREVLDRVWAALLAATGDGRRPVLVGHGHAFGLLLHAIDPSFGFAGHAAMTNPDVYEVRGPPWSFVRLWS